MRTSNFSGFSFSYVKPTEMLSGQKKCFNAWNRLICFFRQFFLWMKLNELFLRIIFLLLHYFFIRETQWIFVFGKWLYSRFFFFHIWNRMKSCCQEKKCFHAWNWVKFFAGKKKKNNLFICETSKTFKN